MSWLVVILFNSAIINVFASGFSAFNILTLFLSFLTNELIGIGFRPKYFRMAAFERARYTPGARADDVSKSN